MNDYPKVIEVQFHNKCNSNCLICPYKDMNYSYPDMNDELFSKLLNEIDENKLVRIIPYLNNEPFLSPIYLDRVEEIRKRFNNLEIEISSILKNPVLFPKISINAPYGFMFFTFPSKNS